MLIKSIRETYKMSLTGIIAVALAFVVFEPMIISGASDQFTISQTVTGEVSFATPASDVTMAPSLPGISGGTANGVTQFIIVSNNLAGYTVTLQASSSAGMIGNASSTNSIPAYVPDVTGVPDYTWSVDANKAGFGYTVNASTTDDVVQLFKNNGASCNQAAGTSNGTNCWLNASTTAVTIIDRSLNTTYSGATTTLNFKVQIQANPSPIIPNDTYVATTTLTATLK